LESISQKRKMLVTEKFIRSLVEKYGKHAVFTNGGTWYPEACNFLQVKRIAYH
jgi:putative transposase